MYCLLKFIYNIQGYIQSYMDKMNLFDFSTNKIKTITNEAQLFIKTCNCLYLKVGFAKLAVDICFLEKQNDLVDLVDNNSTLYKIKNFVTDVELFLTQISKLNNFSYFNRLNQIRTKYQKIIEEFDSIISQFNDYFVLNDRRDTELKIVNDEIIEIEKVSELSKIH